MHEEINLSNLLKTGMHFKRSDFYWTTVVKQVLKLSTVLQNDVARLTHILQIDAYNLTTVFKAVLLI